MAPANCTTPVRQAEFSREDAKKALIDKGWTVTYLAEKRLKLHRNTVSIAINHPTMFPEVRKRIGKELGIK